MSCTVGTKDRLADRAVNEIQDQIMNGQSILGRMLPPEGGKCEQLRVSRTVLCEAVRMLVFHGLLETRPGVGAMAKEVTSDHVGRPMAMILTQSGSTNLDHLNQVRQVLETETFQEADKDASDEEIGRLKSPCQRMERARENPVEYSTLDGDSHRTLAENTQSPFLVILLDATRDAMQSVRLMVFKHPYLANTVNDDHGRMIGLIETHSPGGAGHAVRAHLERARRIQVEMLGSLPRPGEWT